MASAQTIQGRRQLRTLVAAWPAGVPRPIEGCDGSTWSVPIWCPDTRKWERSSFDVGQMKRIFSRAECGERACDALHAEDVKPGELAKIRATVARRPARKVA